MDAAQSNPAPETFPTTPFCEGFSAREKGEIVTTNPYDIRQNEPAFICWDTGWWEAEFMARRSAERFA